MDSTTKPNNIKYVIYARKSTEGDDRQIASIKDQLDVAYEIARRENLKIVKVFKEQGSASKVNNRPLFNEMIKMIKKGQANGILCWESNRLSRNPLESGMLQQLLVDGHLQIIKTHNRTYLPDDNLLIFSVDAGMDAQYSIKLKHDVKRGMNSKNKAGGFSGVAPQGYLNFTDGFTKQHTIIADPDRFQTVQKAFRMYLSGDYTVPEIVSALDEWGYRSKKRKKSGDSPMKLSTFYHMLANPFFAGYIPDYEDETNLIKGSWPPMITLDEYWTIQKMLTRTKKGNTRNTRPRVAVNAKRFELKGIMKCGQCGCSITAELKHKKQKDGSIHDHIYYHCTHKRKDCDQRGGVRQDELYRQIYELLDSYTISQKLYDWGIEIVEKLQRQEIFDKEGVSRSRSTSITSVKNQLNRLLDMAVKGLINDEEYEERSTKMKEVLKQLEDAHQDALEKTQNWYEVVGNTLNTLKNPKEQFSSSTCPGQKRSILQSIGYNPVLINKTIEVEPYKWLKKMVKTAHKIDNSKKLVRTVSDPLKKGSEDPLYLKWLRGLDLNQRPFGYEPNELPDCSTPRC